MRIAIASLLAAVALPLAVGLVPAEAQVTEFILATPASRPSAITRGPDGALWFTEAAGRIGRIATDGAITEFPIKGGGILHAITTGPDGALWFTDFTSKKIGRIPATATAQRLQFVEFAIPGPAGPLSITRGTDGALWFTDAGGKIVRMTSEGTATEFTIPTKNSGPEGITTGPDGALWFTESLSGKIGRITIDGKISEFALPDPDAQPLGITTGPDGALWFTEASCVRKRASRCVIGNKIGRITTTGVITEFAIPSDGSGPHSITAGPDGALWFTEYYGSRIGRLVPP
ncbi:Vgb family protein [Bradyrhizobium sp.]|uniref:Vgb family protein n=1 Tax=Bradyrhizobium sp. TaxID=376 RepID=UPI0040378C66